MRYQAWGRIRWYSVDKKLISIENSVEGNVEFPPHYLDVDKEKTLYFKLTGEESDDT